MPVQASGHITPFLDVSSPSFVHGVPERRPLSGDVRRRSKTRAQRMTGAWRRTILLHSCHCGSQRWFSGCLLQWVMSYFIFFLGLSRENGAWEGSFTAIKSISVPWVSQPLSLRPRFFFFFFDVPNTTFSTQFYETMISTQRYWDKNEAWVFCTLALWSVQEQRHYYISTWNPSNFLQPKRGRNEEK